MKLSSLLFILSLYGSQSNAFFIQSSTPKSSKELYCSAEPSQDDQYETLASTRRDWMKFSFQSLLLVGGLLEVGKGSPSVAVMSVDQKVFTPGESLSVPASKERFLQARKDVQYLLDNYDSISKEGGDAVRRYLGTVGVTGAMYGISKVIKILREEAEDIVEYTEAMDEFNAYLYQAEGAAYQSIFAEHSSAKATPESCLATAKQDVVMMIKYMDKLQAQLNL